MSVARGDQALQRGQSKRKFTQEEDRVILEMVKQYGIRVWKQISERLGSRTPRQCRERWKNYLSPGIDSSPWTHDEDAILEKMVRQLGPKWSIIRDSLPGRTDVNIKNRYALIQRRSMRQGITPDASSKPIAPPVRPVLPEAHRAPETGGKDKAVALVQDTCDFLEGKLALEDLEIFGLSDTLFEETICNRNIANVKK